jgi:hypothetical protein
MRGAQSALAMLLSGLPFNDDTCASGFACQEHAKLPDGECCYARRVTLAASDGGLPDVPRCDSHGARALSDGELARADVVPMHRMRRVRPSGASVSSSPAVSNEPRMRSQGGASGSAARQEGARPLLGPGARTYSEQLPDAPAGAGRAARKPLLGRVGPTIGPAGSGTSNEKHQVWRWPGERDEGDRPRQVRLP